MRKITCKWGSKTKLERKTKGTENEKKDRNHTDYSIIKIGDWEKSWRPEETCCHSSSTKRQPVKSDEKKELGRSELIIIYLHTVSWCQ